MKRSANTFMIFLIFTIASCGGNSRNEADKENSQAADTGNAVISFTEYEHNFGKVNAGEKVGCIFTFRNSGTSSLVINTATTNCGCTVPKYDRKPISPGNAGSLEIIFNTAGYNGMQSKTITVQSNATTPVVVLKITAEVITSNNNQ